MPCQVTAGSRTLLVGPSRARGWSVGRGGCGVLLVLLLIQVLSGVAEAAVVHLVLVLELV